MGHRKNSVGASIHYSTLQPTIPSSLHSAAPMESQELQDSPDHQCLWNVPPIKMATTMSVTPSESEFESKPKFEPP